MEYGSNKMTGKNRNGKEVCADNYFIQKFFNAFPPVVLRKFVFFFTEDRVSFVLKRT